MKHKVQLINVLGTVYFPQKVLKIISPTQFHVFLLKTNLVKMDRIFDIPQNYLTFVCPRDIEIWESDFIHPGLLNHSYEPVL